MSRYCSRDGRRCVLHQRQRRYVITLSGQAINFAHLRGRDNWLHIAMIRRSPSEGQFRWMKRIEDSDGSAGLLQRCARKIKSAVSFVPAAAAAPTYPSFQDD